jgi:hypothetical protein
MVVVDQVVRPSGPGSSDSISSAGGSNRAAPTGTIADPAPTACSASR